MKITTVSEDVFACELLIKSFLEDYSQKLDLKRALLNNCITTRYPDDEEQTTDFYELLFFEFDWMNLINELVSDDTTRERVRFSVREVLISGFNQYCEGTVDVCDNSISYKEHSTDDFERLMILCDYYDDDARSIHFVIKNLLMNDLIDYNEELRYDLKTTKKVN